MTNKDILIKMIDNLNENGIDLLTKLFCDMDKNEKYNKFTTPDRLEELQQINKQKEDKQKTEIEAKRIEEEARLTIEENKTQEFLNEYSRFLNDIRLIKPGNYWLTFGEIEAIHLSCKNDMYSAIYNSFKAGFLKGQRAEKAKQKRLREKARAC